ncbi:MAG: extracellular solute-binding protein [Candidatus Buchananbacteria bacterium]
MTEPMLNPKFKKIIAPINLLLVLAFILSSGFGCKLQSAQVKEKMQPITLNFWSVYDDQDAYDEIIAAYQAVHPNIEIKYRKFRFEEYEQQLLDAWAEDRGPDIYSIPASWMVKYKSKIEPMPDKITMAYVYEKGALKKETITELKTSPTVTLRQLKDGFPEVVSNNVVMDGKIYGLPLSVDTMILFYNKDILNNAGIVSPPSTWKEFQDNVKKITRLGTTASGTPKIIQAGTALGTGNNIDRAFDIISLLMLQSNAISANQSSYPVFYISGKESNPGYDAITFYTDFAIPGKDVYSWNSQMPNSLEAFMSGQVAMTFGYNFNLATIKARSPKLNLGIAPIPQLNSESPKNYANYWIQTVAKKSKHNNEAWDFVLFMSQGDMASKYLTKTKKPAAVRSLISTQLEDEDLRAAALQTLTAVNWYRGYDPLAAESAFKTMSNQFIDAIDEKLQMESINMALEKIRQTYNNPNPASD